MPVNDPTFELLITDRFRWWKRPWYWLRRKPIHHYTFTIPDDETQVTMRDA